MKVEIIGFNHRNDTYRYTADGLTKEATISRVLEIEDMIESGETISDEERCLAICSSNAQGDNMLGETAEYP